jgi:hypothetical protein
MNRSTPWSSQFTSPDRGIHFDVLRRVYQVARITNAMASLGDCESTLPPPKTVPARKLAPTATKAKVSGMLGGANGRQYTLGIGEAPSQTAASPRGCG